MDDKRRTVERLLRVWEANPQLHLGQLLSRATRDVKLEYVFDDELLTLLEASLNRTERRQLDVDFPLHTPD